MEHTARTWYEHTLSMRRPGHGVGGFSYPSARQDGRPRRDGGFLTGASGIGLALLAAVSDRDPSWDRVLLLSSCKLQRLSFTE